MKKLKKLSEIMASLMVAVNISIFSSVINAEAVGEMNLDTVFVTDSSGSMLNSDEDRIAEEAAKLIIDLCDKESCSAGLVVYGGEVTNSPELLSLDNMGNVNSLKRNIDEIQYKENDTNISLGIEKGYELLEESRKKENNKNPLMILLTDGRTDISNMNPELTQQAQDYIMEVIENNTYDNEDIADVPIYTIGLHSSGDILDMETLQNIAEKTGGIAFEADTADDLPDIVMTIFQNYNNIKPSQTTPFVQTDVPAGYSFLDREHDDIYCYKADFQVENDSVNYTNIVITHLDSNVLDYEIAVPDSQLKMNHKNNNDISFSNSYKYTSVKMKPKGFSKDGNWTVYVYTDKMAEMSLNVMNTYDLYVEQSLNMSEARTEESVKIDAVILEDGQPVSDEKLLADIDSNEGLRKAYVIDKSTGMQVEEVTLQRTDGSTYSGEVVLNNAGYYEIVSTLGSANFSKTSGKSYVNVFDKWTNARIGLEVSSEKIDIGESMDFTVTMYDGNTPITNPENKTAELEITGAETKTIPMITDTENGCFRLKYTPETKGYFQAVARIKDDTSNMKSNGISFNVMPKAPISRTDETKKYTVSTGISGLFEKSVTLRLSDIFEWDSDSDIDAVIYMENKDLVNVTMKEQEDDYEILIKAVAGGQTEASIKITDMSTGKSLDYVVYIESVNWYDPFIIPALAVSALIILIVLVVIFGGAKLGGQRINMTLILSETLRNRIGEPATQSFNLPKGRRSVSLNAVIQNNSHLRDIYRRYNDELSFSQITSSIIFRPYSDGNYRNGVAVEIRESDRISSTGNGRITLNTPQTIVFDDNCSIIINHENTAR